MQKQKLRTKAAVIFLASGLSTLAPTVGLIGCSSPQKPETAPTLSGQGPTILKVSPSAGLIELDDKRQPTKPAQIFADIKSLDSKVVEAKLKVQEAPLEVPMINVGGTRWRAELNRDQLQSLSMEGKTIRYNAIVIAKDKEGRTSMTNKPVTLSIKTPAAS